MNLTHISSVERGIKDATFIRATLTAEEQKVFNKIKRSLMRTYINPNYSVKMLIDVAALEYIQYTRQVAEKESNSSRTARSIMECLSELDLTPKSKKSSEVTNTLSQIFQNIKGANNA